MRRKILLMLCLCLSLFLIINGCSSTASKKPLTPAPQKKVTQTGQMTASERRVLASKLSKTAESINGVKKATVVVVDVGMSSNNRGAIPTPGTTTDNKRISTYPSPGTMDDAPLPTQNVSNSGQTKSIKPNNDVWLNNQANGVVVMVGLTIDPAVAKNQKKIGSIKTMVMNKLKASDRRITQVLVSTDPNMVKRLSDVAAGIIQGKPIKTFEKDIRDLNNRFKREKPTL